MPSYLIDGGSHIDRPLSNLAMKAFVGSADMIGQMMFPPVQVGKQSDTYYVIDQSYWLRVPDTTRAPKSPAKVAEWAVSSDRYFAKNFAQRTDYALETIANADEAIQVRESSAMFITELLMRDRELRIANMVSSVSNVGSGVVLTGADKFSDYAGSDPISVVKSGTAFIRQRTGLMANTLILDYDTAAVLRDHPVLRDYVKYTQGPSLPDGALSDAQLASIFRVPNVWIGSGIFNAAAEGNAPNTRNIWGNVAILAHIRPPQGLRTATAGLSFQWRPEGFPAPMVIERYPHPDPSVKAEYVEAQYFQDEKIVARDLIYTITGTL